MPVLISDTVDALSILMMNQIKNNCLNSEYTNEKSIVVDQIDFVIDQMKTGMSFIDAVKRLQK